MRNGKQNSGKTEKIEHRNIGERAKEADRRARSRSADQANRRRGSGTEMPWKDGEGWREGIVERTKSVMCKK